MNPGECEGTKMTLPDCGSLEGARVSTWTPRREVGGAGCRWVWMLPDNGPERYRRTYLVELTT